MGGLERLCACMRTIVFVVLQFYLLSKSISKQSDEIDGKNGGGLKNRIC